MVALVTYTPSTSACGGRWTPSRMTHPMAISVSIGKQSWGRQSPSRVLGQVATI